MRLARVSPLSTLAVVAALSFATLAHADIPPSNSQGCDGKSAGATCSTDQGATGTCATSKCTSLNYSCEAGADGAPHKGGPCGSIERDCLVCTTGSSAGSGSCVVAGRDAAAGAPLALLALGLGLFAGRRARGAARTPAPSPDRFAGS